MWSSSPQLPLTGPVPLVHLFDFFFFTLPLPARPLLPMKPQSLSFLCFHSAGTLGGWASSLLPGTPVHVHSPHFLSSASQKTQEWGKWQRKKVARQPGTQGSWEGPLLPLLTLWGQVRTGSENAKLACMAQARALCII